MPFQHLLFFLSLLLSFSLSQYNVNILSDPSFTESGYWYEWTRYPAVANFTYGPNGVTIQISNVGTINGDIEISNTVDVNSNTLYISSSNSYVLTAEALSIGGSNRQFYMVLDTGFPDYIWFTNFNYSTAQTTWTRFSTCFRPSINSTARLALKFGGNDFLNSNLPIQIRTCNVIPVVSCGSYVTTGFQVTTGQSTDTPTTTNDKQSSNSGEEVTDSRTTIYAAIGASTGVILLIIAITAFVVVRKKSHAETQIVTEAEDTKDHVESYSEIAIAMSNVNPPVKELIRNPDSEIDYNELIFGEQIGSGAFGVVFKGEWRHQFVAIKKLKLTNGTSELNLFREETAIMLSIRPHKNVLLLLGVCSKDPENLCIVTDFYPNGSMDKYLRKSNVSKLQKCEFIRGIAAGMAHLCKEGVVHRDLSTRNVLLDGTVPKIADFGLSRIVDENSQRKTNSNTGPLKCINAREYSFKSDVWMFGCTCYEIIYLSSPYPEYKALDAAVLVARHQLKPSIPPETEWGVIATVMTSCFHFDPSDRPTFEEICNVLGRSNFNSSISNNNVQSEHVYGSLRMDQ